MFSVLLHNIMSFHCICHIFNSIHIWLHPIYSQIHVSSSLAVEDLSTKYVTYFVLLTSLRGISLHVASRADSVSHQHPSAWISDFCRFEEGLFCWGWRGLGKEIFSDSVCSAFSCVVVWCLLQCCLVFRAGHTITLIHI